MDVADVAQRSGLHPYAEAPAAPRAPRVSFTDGPVGPARGDVEESIVTTSTVPYEVESTPLTGTQRVFVARRPGDATPLLIKRLRGAYPTTEEVATLRHEHNVLSRLRGAPVPEVIELVQDHTNPGLVLTRAPGKSIDEIMRRGAVAIPRCVALALSVSRCLAAVHARGVVHRDIKPQHLFVDEDSEKTTLIDFGLATRLPRERQVPVQPDELQGTLAYISPEQTGRTNHSVDQRSDLYSLGVTLYELTTGKLPFASDDALELLHSHIARLPAAPRLLRAEIPEALQDIILRLLSKSPDQRYHTAAGVAADLERIEKALQEGTDVPSFELGQSDHDGQLRVPEKLYGRDAQRATLLDIVRRVQRGEKELTLIVGPPGVGKSALVHEVHQELVRRGHFVAGKFDQYNRGIPYSALATACGELVRVYLASPPGELEAWRERLRTALGENARVVMDVVPELELALGEQPAASPLPPTESQARFERSFRRFMEASACDGAPLVLFLDDLQWADSASLGVLELVLSSGSQGHLLVIGNYRENEVDHAHPLTNMLDAIAKHVHIERIDLSPLSSADVRQFVADALPLTQQSPEPLADLIFEKTSGNPFFVGQFLYRLGAQGQLSFEAGRGYGWDLETVKALDATDNVVDLVVNRLAALAPDAQQLLRFAACIGHTFRLRTLSVIAEMELRPIASALAPAVNGGYLLPLDKNHRLLEELLEGDDTSEVDATYRFAHDRVQQAALSTLDAAERATTHLRIGRLLLSATGEAGPGDDQLFEVVSQFNLGREHIQSAEERSMLAALNLKAAFRAKSAAAHASVLDFAGTCLALLSHEPFDAHHEALMAAHLLAAEAHYLSHQDEAALKHIEDIEANAKNVLERAPARNLKSNVITNQGKAVEASAVSIETLALLGLDIPDPHDPDALGAAIGAAFGAYQAALGDRDVASLLELPVMTDPEQLALLGTIAGTIPSAFQWNPNLVVLLVLKAVGLPLEHGTAPFSPFFYAQYGIVHHVVTGDPVRAHDFGKLALELCHRPECAAARGGVEFIYAEFLCPWVRPRTDCMRHFRQGIIAGLDAGDQVHAAFSMAVGIAEALYAGQSLSDLQAQIPDTLRALTDQGEVLNHMLVVMLQRGIACLQGTTECRASMDGGGFSEEAFEAQAPPPVKAHFGVVKAMARYLFGDLEAARSVTEESIAPPGVVFKVDYVFYHGMACAGLAAAAEETRRGELLAQAEADLANFENWVETCPHNFLPLAELLGAELSAVRGETTAALNGYERAIAAAHQSQMIHYLALAYERLGRLHARDGRRVSATMNLREAARHYQIWGAEGKTAQLVEEFPEVTLVTRSREGALQQTVSNTHTIGSGISGFGGGRLDLTSAMRAVNAIASEVRLEPLLERLMHLLVENAGATRGVLLLSESGGLFARAMLRVEPKEVRLGLYEPLGTTNLLASSVVHYCARTLEAVVLDEASADNRFAQDAFITEHRSSSIICLPLVHQGQLVGVLYLENNTANGAFHAARVERLEFLAGHAGVALQNARLYDQLEAANESLERRVRERTAELSERNSDMRRVLDNVTQGLLTIDLQGQLATEHSRVVAEWFGTLGPGMAFRDYIERASLEFAEHFAVAFEQLVEGFLPEQVALTQLPHALTHDGRHFSFNYEPIHVEAKLAGLLIVIDDVTEALRRAREEAEQKEVLAMCRSLSRDRSGLLGFFAEGRSLISSVTNTETPRDERLRGLHTLKGNSALFEFSLLAEACHRAEQALGDGADAATHTAKVVERFEALQRSVESIAGRNAIERVEVSRAVLKKLSQQLATGVSQREASEAIERLWLEPLNVPLGRLGDYARALCARLGKGTLSVEVDDGGLLADSERSAPLFGALVHLVRNAVDHGLESPEVRQGAGKGTASLSLSAVSSDGEVCITVRDDGQGIDWELIRERAEARGLPNGSEQALVDALFAPELSTRSIASEVSGRGVGLAAVKAEVERLSGRIEVDRSMAPGTCFRVHVPAHALGVQPSTGISPKRRVVESWPAPAF